MPIHYRKNAPYFRSLTHTIRCGDKRIALTVEGRIWNDNGFKDGDVVEFIPKGKGKLLIKRVK